MIKFIKKLYETFESFEVLRLMKHSFVYGIGDIVQRSLSIILLPIYTRYLTPTDYGIISLLAIFNMIVGTITMCGLTNGISRYFYYTDQENTSLSKVVWSPFVFIAIFSIVVMGVLGIFSKNLSVLLLDSQELSYLVVLTLMSIFVSNLSGVGRSILIFEEKVMTVNYINIAGVLVGVGAGVFFVVVLGRGVTGAVEAGLIGAVIMSVPILLLSMARFKPAFSGRILRKELKFSLPLVAAIFAFWFIDSSDRYLIKIFLPLSEVGLYNIGYNIGLVMMIIVGGFTSAWPPFYHRNNQNNEGQGICDDVLKFYLLVTSFMVVLLSLLAPIAIKILTTERFYGAYSVVPWVAMAYLLKGPYIIFLMGVYVRDKTNWQLYLEGVAAVANLGLNIIFIPVIGREAAAISTFFSYAVLVIGSYLMVMRINPIPGISWRYILGIMIPCFTISVSSAWLPYDEGYFAVAIALFGLFILISIYLSYREIIPLLKKKLGYV